MINQKCRWKSWTAIVLGFVAVTLGGFANRAWSEDLPPPAASGDLEQRVKILERKLEIADENAGTKAKESPVVKVGSEGFQVQSADKAFSLKIGGLLQADSRSFIDDTAGIETNQFLIRRLRPILTGTIYRDFSFNFTPDFANNGKNVLVDAYLDIAPWTFAKLRVGKFKPPIGFEHLQSDPYVVFAERGFPSLLTPTRDTGFQVFGDLANGAFSYAAAATNGVGDNNLNPTQPPALTGGTGAVYTDTDNNDGKEATARVVFKPFKNTDRAALQGLSFGVGGSYAPQNITNPSYSTPGQLTSNIYTVANGAADGPKFRIAPELAWYYHSLGIYGEFIRSSQLYRLNTVRHSYNNDAWQAAGSYVLTGEDASYTGVKPRKPFDVQNGTWGAFEVVARYGVLDVDPHAFDGLSGSTAVLNRATSIQRETQWTAGINWYLNAIVRFSTEYDQTTFDKGAAIGDRPNEKVVITRWQVYF